MKSNVRFEDTSKRVVHLLGVQQKRIDKINRNKRVYLDTRISVVWASHLKYLLMTSLRLVLEDTQSEIFYQVCLKVLTVLFKTAIQYENRMN